MAAAGSSSSSASGSPAQASGGGGGGGGVSYHRSRFGDTTLTKVFVGGLAWETLSTSLHDHFREYGEILEVVVITDRETGQSKVYGFVTFRDPESARQAVQNPNPMIAGRRANCNIASMGPPCPSPHRSEQGDAPARTDFTSSQQVSLEVLMLGAVPPRSSAPGVLGAGPALARRVDASSTARSHINGGAVAAKQEGEPDLDSCFAHFWSRSRVSPPPSSTGDLFGWWLVKVADDSRSFAQVVRDPALMADQGARFNQGHRLDGFGAGRQGHGAGRQDRGRARPNVWQHNSPEQQQSSSTSRGATALGRWEAAAAAQGAQDGVRSGTQPDRWAVAAMGGQDACAVQGGRPEENRNVPGNIDSCLHCRSTAHLSARCPTLVCERCGRSGHLQASCLVILPWECMAQMCAFQSKGQGFFYMHDFASAKQLKDRSSSVVISMYCSSDWA
ncbi:hypothetical protein BRADI_1g66323v3 [Brachypodium distachyon]|uniref:RRM domain-containing protein n=1 Tax=Brachypodium distachyon TaxID=15368 RepID=A0A0Q3SBI3_BRADI|nr:hypothetical protein BRADI_1g66323v3 [Brachypodium distachyon]